MSLAKKTPENTYVASIAYIPLDNRSVNTDRAVWLAESAGFKIIMPSEDLYRTALDGQEKNSNGTAYGDGDALLDCLDSCEADYYVILVDQILSVGLVNSRVTTKSDNDLNRINHLSAILNDKKTVLFDTVIRLASTVGYSGGTISDYEQTREYGMKEEN